MIEYSLIKVFLKKKEFDAYYQYLPSSSNRELQRILYSLKNLHSTGKEEYSVEELELCFYAEYPALKPAERELYAILFKRIRDTDADPTHVENYLLSLRESIMAHKIATLSLEVYEGRKPMQELQDALKELDTPSPIGEELKFVTDDLEELYSQHVAKLGLRWRLSGLNKSLGSLRKGDFGFVFARPETGKTTFLASEVTHMAEQLEEDDGPILWCNNEEQGEKVKRRIIVAALGKPEKEVFADRPASAAEYKRRTKGKILLLDEPTMSKAFLEKAFEATKPSLIIIDQIDKITGFDADRDDLHLGKIYQWAREIAKTYCPVIAVCQSDGTGEGVKRLTMKHVANAKTSKQAEADWILGIGRTEDDGYGYWRYMNISKNKLSGDEDSVPEMRHGFFETIIEPDIARYKDIHFD